MKILALIMLMTVPSLRSEPMVKNGKLTLIPQGRNGPFDGITPNGWFGYCNENLIWIRHAGLPESRCYLRVPEEAAWEGRKRLDIRGGTSVSWLSTHEGGERPAEHNYQAGMTWKKKGGALFYEPCSLRNPFGPSPGLISASLSFMPGDAIRVSVEIRNTSAAALNKVNAHFCLNHRLAPLLGRHIFVRSKNGWENFNDYRNDTPYRSYHFGDTASKFPAVSVRALFTTFTNPGGPFTVAIGGKAVMALSSNSEWPCTDIRVDFGDIAPGGESAREFFVLVSGLDRDKALETMEKLIR